MRIRLDVVETLTNGDMYMATSAHRGKGANHNKSIWVVSTSREVACFLAASTADPDPAQRWGQGYGDPKWTQLGRNSVQEPLFFAKFVNSDSALPWHGYPADYRRRSPDRPPMEVLRDWLHSGVLRKDQMAKIAGGKPCSL